MPYSRSVIFKNKFHAAYKWVLSFRKTDWELGDYPVSVAKQTRDPSIDPSRFTMQPYRAYIINWAFIGLGDTPAEARAKLAENFAKIKAGGKALTRPGRTRPVEFASQEKVFKDEALSEEFIQKVLDLEWAWISDESSLWDFHGERTNDRLHARIREVYGIDVSDIESGRLWVIFERIEKSRQAQILESN